MKNDDIAIRHYTVVSMESEESMFFKKASEKVMPHLSNDSSLEPLNCPIVMVFHFEYPFRSYRLSTGWQLHHFLCIILFKKLQFCFDSISPLNVVIWICYCFFIGCWFIYVFCC